MGVFSKIHRFREAGEEANVNNVEQFGQPAISLFTTTKVFSLHHHIDITDSSGNIRYQADSKFLSLHDKTDIRRATGEHVAHIERKLLTLHERHFVTMADGSGFQLSNELFHFIKDITNIEGLDWQLKGNCLGLNFELYDGSGNIIAVIGQKLFSIHDKYCIDIYREEYEEKVVAILVTLQHMIRDRQSSHASASSGSSGN
ncbi:MAG: LURP-one-related family protein [Treponema sp.]|nr:LURP-one-related family protein [Treponema sp.]